MTKRRLNGQLSFGLTSRPLRQQLSELGVKLDALLVRQMQKDADAIGRLAVRSLLSDSEVSKAYRRLLNSIVKELNSA
jgi:hypothetical protein